jgi:hypothetical protein
MRVEVSEMNAREIMAALRNRGFLAVDWVDNGGGVYCLAFTPICQHDVVLGDVRVTAGLDWAVGDFEADTFAVSVTAYSTNAHPVWMSVGQDAATVAGLVEDYSIRLEATCAACGAEVGEECRPMCLGLALAEDTVS